MLRLFFCAFIFAAAGGMVMGTPERPFDSLLAPGVSRELARWRAARYRDVRYALRVELAAGASQLVGEEEIRLTLGGGPADDLVLDWRAATRDGEPQARVWDVEVNGQSIAAPIFRSEHLVIPAKYLRAGENLVRLKFTSPIAASGSAVTRYLDREDKSEYLYTLFVPSDASTAFPCFDQPDLKARFRLSVVAPAAWKVITNTHEEKTTTSDDRTLWRFRETEPLSTYVFAFAAGPFAEYRDEDSPQGTRLYVRRSKAARAQRELAEVFRLNREGLAFLARYFDYPFPFPKYDLVIIPEFAYGGMEHAGATFLREESILFPTEPTANDLLTRAELIFHEAAHQWFGDLVTMRWFDDLWLKEGFATFMAYKTVEMVMPQYDPWKAFSQRTKATAYLTDVTKGTTPIWQEIGNLSAAKSAYGNIVYRKAPSMLRQAEFFIGPSQFRRAVQSLLQKNAFGNAEWADLVRAFEKSSGRKLGAWADAWVRRRGMAGVRAVWRADRRGRINRFTLTQEDVLGEGGLWPMRVKVLLAYRDAPPQTFIVTLRGRETEVPRALGRPRPHYVFVNYEDYGYGRFLLDDASRAIVLRDLGTIRDDFLRALLWSSLWESVREAELAPALYLDLALRLAATERDEVTAAVIMGRVQIAFNRYLSDAQRAELAPRLEQFLFEQTQRAPAPGLRITYFRAFREVAATASGLARLKGFLRDEIRLPGLSLRPRDRFDLVTALLARGDREAPALLEELKSRETSDDARRYAYAAGAARADAETKKRYFTAYTTDRELAESWIEASLGPFNAAQHETLTLPYLEPALAELPRLKRTRKIFFVNGWLAAFLGGQCRPAALATVERFLKEGSLDADLRLKVLEAADGLGRCARIKERHARE